MASGNERKAQRQAAKLIRDAEISFLEFGTDRDVARLMEVLRLQMDENLLKSVESFAHGAFIAGFGRGFDHGTAAERRPRA